jgi:hypothetical protein
MLRKLLVRDSAEERIQVSQPKNNPFTGTELISNPWLFQFNEVTPDYWSSGSSCRQFRPTRDVLIEDDSFRIEPPMGLVATGGVTRARGSVFSLHGKEEELSLLSQQRPLLLNRLLDGSSSRQIILYSKKANRKTVYRFLEDIRRVESFSLE